MRGASRTIREGSVGLLVLVGLGIVGAILLWLNRFNPNQQSYKIIVEFNDVVGMQTGTPVRYRGVKVGNISSIRPGTKAVEVELEITQPNVVIPRDVKVEANQVGLISENVIDIVPRSVDVQASTKAAGIPTNATCNSELILCDNSRLTGEIGVSMDEVLRTTTEFARLYGTPQFYDNVNAALKETAIAAGNVATLTRSLNTVSRKAQSDLSSLSSNTQSQLNNFSRTAEQLGDTAEKVGNSTIRLSTTADRTLNQFGATANEIRSTTTQVGQLVKNLDSLVATNRSTLVATLNNLASSSRQLQTTLTTLSPSIDRLTQGEIIQNLETLTANAAEASSNLRNASESLTDPKNALLLQQTLDSARLTFENTQKITADLDELTGDPRFRQNLRQLVNGLSGLVSSSQQIEQQVKIAQSLETIQLSDKPLTPETFQLSHQHTSPKTTKKTKSKSEQERLRSLKRLQSILNSSSNSAQISAPKQDSQSQ